MGNLAIVGASGHGRVVADIAVAMQAWDNIAFLDDCLTDSGIPELPIIGMVAEVKKFVDEYEFVIAIGDNRVRKTVSERVVTAGGHLATLVHPQASIGSRVTMGAGTVAMAGAVINCDTHIGRGCIVNTAASIDHDCRVEDYVHVSPGVHLAGTVTVGSQSWLGIGSIVSNNISIASDCTIGARTLVLHDIEQPGTYTGLI